MKRNYVPTAEQVGERAMFPDVWSGRGEYSKAAIKRRVRENKHMPKGASEGGVPEAPDGRERGDEG